MRRLVFVLLGLSARARGCSWDAGGGTTASTGTSGATRSNAGATGATRLS
jgi:hypothetical protein